MVLQQSLHGGLRIHLRNLRLPGSMDSLGDLSGLVHHREKEDRERIEWGSGCQFGQRSVVGSGRCSESVGFVQVSILIMSSDRTVNSHVYDMRRDIRQLQLQEARDIDVEEAPVRTLYVCL
jgi:hypothetical protein